jgi:OOP family OmpA-OmpF porin
VNKLWLILLGILAYLFICYACSCSHRDELLALMAKSSPGAASPGAGVTPSIRPSVGAVQTVSSGDAVGALEVVREGGKVRLSGTVPSRAVKEALIAEAMKRYGADGFVEALEVASPEGKVDPDWQALALKSVVWGGLGDVAIDGRTVILRGKQPDESAKGRRYDYVKSVLPGGWEARDEMTLAEAMPVPSASATPGSTNATTPQNLKAFKNISFETGSAVITSEGERLLKEAAEVMETTVPTRYEIGGHTDDRGAVAANQNLSERRADAVRKYLMDAGIVPERLTARGYGESRPVASNATAEGRARNRRIEFTELK